VARHNQASASGQGALFAGDEAVPAPAGAPPGEGPPPPALSTPLADLFDAVPPDWRTLTEPFRASPEGRALIARVDAARAAGEGVFPDDVFAALRLTRRADVRVVILGQDPYHGPGQAHGLAFSVRPGVAIPPSLRNMRKEWQRDLGLTPPTHGSLTRWAGQGVLLLNTVLTVAQGQAASHAKWGWEARWPQTLARAPSCCGVPMPSASCRSSRPLRFRAAHPIATSSCKATTPRPCRPHAGLCPMWATAISGRRRRSGMKKASDLTGRWPDGVPGARRRRAMTRGRQLK